MSKKLQFVGGLKNEEYYEVGEYGYGNGVVVPVVDQDGCMWHDFYEATFKGKIYGKKR